MLTAEIAEIVKAELYPQLNIIPEIMGNPGQEK
jgi:hypothetical protein